MRQLRKVKNNHLWSVNQVVLVLGMKLSSSFSIAKKKFLGIMEIVI